MPSYKAGQEIDAFCTKCKMDLLHRIVAVASGKPARVECRTCKTTHNYRPAKGVKSPGAVAPAAAAPAPRPAGRASSPPGRRKSIEPPPPLVPPSSASVHPYKLSERFAPETWLQHKTFGVGRVLRHVPPDKIEVQFDGGNRVLIHGKAD